MEPDHNPRHFFPVSNTLRLNAASNDATQWMDTSKDNMS